MNKIKKSKNFEMQLNDLINNCELEIDTAYYILKSTLLELEKTYNFFLLKEDEEKMNFGNLQEEEAE